MAQIYLKGSENTLILEPREYMLRQFDFGLWTEIRLGFIFSAISSSNNNAVGVNETIALSGALDRLCFGIKNTDTTVIPGQTGCRFLGVVNSGNVTLSAASQQIAEGFGGMRFGAGVDTTIAVNTGFASDGMLCPANPALASSYGGFYALKLTVANRGLSTQTVTASTARQATVAGTDYSVSALRSLITGGTYGTPSNAMVWNDGVSAYALPDCFYIRMPFLNNRIRLSSIEAIKIS